MDIQRDPPRRKRPYVIGAIVVGLLLVGTLAVTRLRPAVTTLDRGVLTFDTVSMGDMVRDVRAAGTLVPEHVRIIVATTGGRVERLPVRPGDPVHAGTTLVQLSNPDVDLQVLQVQQQLTQAFAALAALKSSQEQQRLSQENALAQLRTQKREAERALSVLDSLDRQRMATRNEVAAARDRAQELNTRYDLEVGRSTAMRAAEQEQRRYAEQQVDGLKRILASERERSASMNVTAGEEGELQSLGVQQLELGQWVNSGTELARVVHPGKLKAVLRVPETQAKDLANGMAATVDTHEGVVRGHVSSIEPGARGGTVAVEVMLDGPLPRVARADLGVDGAIEIERLRNVLHVGRPAYGVAEASLRLYRIVPNTNDAVRVEALLGKGAVTQIEIRKGLARGDSIIISDMSQMLKEERVKLRGAQ